MLFPRLLLIGCIALAAFSAGEPPPAAQAAPGAQTADPPARQVNIPFYTDTVRHHDSAIFWFGRVGPTSNYADVRLGYTATELVVRVHVIDRFVRHDTTPSAAELTGYDAVSLYLALDGNNGTSLNAQDFRFVAMHSSSAGNPAAQAAYRGNGAAWDPASVAFAAFSTYRGNGPNDAVEDRGWTQDFTIRFDQLGLSGAPAEGSVWGLAVTVHDRDDAAGTAIPVQTWPENLNTGRPGTWGRLRFGLPVFQPPNTPVRGTTTIRQGLNGAAVMDAAVGGTIDNLCPGNSNYIWNQWGNANFSGAPRFNLQNQADIADWPCFAKYYVSFPLGQIPAGKTVLSATLTLHQFGGSNPDLAQRSVIQVFTLSETWSESSLTWNNAPPALENVSRATVDVVRSCSWPCVPRNWDVSLAADRALKAGKSSLDLALYEADAPYHSGKHFIGSDEPAWNAVARPTLTVVWGDENGGLVKSASPGAPKNGETVSYRIEFVGTGGGLSLTDALPEGLGAPAAMLASLGQLQYNPGPRTLTWSGSPAAGQVVILSYQAQVQTAERRALVNTATITGDSGSFAAEATVIANGFSTYLPLLRR